MDNITSIRGHKTQRFGRRFGLSTIHPVEDFKVTIELSRDDLAIAKRRAGNDDPAPYLVGLLHFELNRNHHRKGGG